MIIKFGNTELTVKQVNGTRRYLYGADRDCLEIIFDKASHILTELDNLFSDSASLQKITLVDDSNGEFIHYGYTIKDSIASAVRVVSEATALETAETVEEIKVLLARETYAENTLKRLDTAIKDPENIDVRLIDRVANIEHMINDLLMGG